LYDEVSYDFFLMMDPPYTERSMHVIRDLVHDMTEARDSWLDNCNVEMWTHDEDVANDDMLKEELWWMKTLVCIAVGIICVMFAMLMHTWSSYVKG